MTVTNTITVPHLGTVSEDSSACIQKKDTMTVGAGKLTDGGGLYATELEHGHLASDVLYFIDIVYSFACPIIPCYAFVIAFCL